ncbi:MAG: hypothetical protein MJY98_05200 [Fibrobacter sp.]|nr:hypothetical protein [Fibrobacter sp.]
MIDIVKIVFGILGAGLAVAITAIIITTIIGGIKSAQKMGDGTDEDK